MSIEHSDFEEKIKRRLTAWKFSRIDDTMWNGKLYFIQDVTAFHKRISDFIVHTIEDFFSYQLFNVFSEAFKQKTEKLN